MVATDRPGTSYTVADLVDRLLDKGLVINADIAISVAGVELLGIKIRAAVASFETAAKYGLAFPSGTDFHSPGWCEATSAREPCPACGRREPRQQLLTEGCPWCGWIPPAARAASPAGRRQEAEVQPWLSKLMPAT